MSKNITLKTIFKKIIDFNLVLLIKPTVVIVTTILVIFIIIWFGYSKYIEYNNSIKLANAQANWDRRKGCVIKLNDIPNTEIDYYKKQIISVVNCISDNELLNQALVDSYLRDEELGRVYLRAVKNYHIEPRPTYCGNYGCN